METPGAGKSTNTTLSFRYNANNEELEELFNPCLEDDPPTPQCDPPSVQSENASPKRGDRTPSIIDKYFKSMRADKQVEKDETKPSDTKLTDKEETRSASSSKEISSSPMKDYLNRLSKRSTPEVTDLKEGSNETWKIFHDFKFKIAQAVEDMKTRSLEESREKSVPRENSTSDSEENSAFKDVDQHSVGDTDNQVSSLDSSIQNLSEVTQPITAKPAEIELSLPLDNKNSESSDDTHKNIAHSDMAEDLLDDNLLDVESGVEALEDGFGDVTNVTPATDSDKPLKNKETNPQITPTNGLAPSQSSLKTTKENSPKSHFLNFTMYFLTIFLIVNYILFPKSNVWIGFLLGIWFFSLVSHAKYWFLDKFFCDWEPQKGSIFQLKRNSIVAAPYTIPSVKEHTPMKKFEGWINHYRSPDYDPYTYHINKTTTAFMKLEGCDLRISYTRAKIPKRALWDEKIEKVQFYQHRLYNLTGARVILLPKGLVKRRQWSKKYPICVILNEKEKIQVVEKENTPPEKKLSETVIEKNKKEQLSQHESESTETNTSPEKKKKFVWRRREKSVPHTEGDTGREGLRHRLVRKMHRDKKTDNVSTCTETVSETHTLAMDKEQVQQQLEDNQCSEDGDLTTKSIASKEEVEEDIDETVMSRIKELLDDAELEPGADGTTEGEWSVHVRPSVDKHSHLYLFTRTGRDKHEWYRQLTKAIKEANASAESSAADDKSVGEQSTENKDKDSVEFAVYKPADKDTVSFGKNSNKPTELLNETAPFTSIPTEVTKENDYETNFWPYLLKIIEHHELSVKKASVGVMCQIEPTPQDRSKNKKKRKTDNKTATECECGVLPSEVTWLNTTLARVMYDVMRDPQLIARVQGRIQKKLNTLKLPSFMSPLVITDLSLSGACPLVSRVLAPAWDARGVWLDADLRYDGGAYIVLLTQINLMKLKEKNITLEDHLLAANENTVENESSGSPTGFFSEKLMRKRKPAIYDSEVEDSAESSSDDETPPVHPVDSDESVDVTETTAQTPQAESGSSKRKFLRMVDKIATNKYFQQVTDYKYVKRAMEGLSNTDIKLHLEIQLLEGRLTLNLPAPPHDRIWIGFRTNPQLILKARPAVGARTLRFAHISNWIEQKLSKEFEKVLVLPNMEDIIVDVMTPTPVHFE